MEENIKAESSFELINIIPIRSGRDAVIVYIIMYRLAWSRSGWYPQIRIRNKVGIKDVSKAM